MPVVTARLMLGVLNPTRRSITCEAAAPTLTHEAIDGWTCIDPEPSVLSL
jgi:hypothetical protein